jgi:hypothetical protein
MKTATKHNSFSRFLDLLLARLYEMESIHGTGIYFSLNNIAEEIKEPSPWEWIFDAAKVLESRGMIQCIHTPGGIFEAILTGEGRLFVEERKGSGIIEKYFSSPDLFIKQKKNGKKTQTAMQGTAEFPQTLSIKDSPMFKLLKDIEDSVKKEESLGEKDKKDILVDIKTIKTQMEKREPNYHVLSAIIHSLGNYHFMAGKIAFLVRLLNV